MTVELRTDPPVAKLIVRNGSNITELSGDPFNEAGDRRGMSNTVKRATEQFASSTPTPESIAKFNRILDADNQKTYAATSIFIDGLDEHEMAATIQAFQAKIDAGQHVGAFAKGTRFGGHDTSSLNSVMASILKLHLPQNMSVKTGVKFRWELADLVRYAAHIRQALEESGVQQQNQGWMAKKSLLPGFSIVRVS